MSGKRAKPYSVIAENLSADPSYEPKHRRVLWAEVFRMLKDVQLSMKQTTFSWRQR